MYIFGGGSKRKKVKPQYTGLATQTSTTMVPVPIGMGLNRVTDNIVWQGDFKSHKQTQKTGKGGGKTTTGYTYSGSFVLGLGWGPATAIRTVWKDQSTTTLADLGMTLIAGTVPQAPWGFLTTNHPTEALGYPGLVQVVVPNYDLGQSNTLGQHSFEVEWPLLNTAPGGVGDADPAQCVNMLLNSNLFGALVGQPPIPVEMLLSTGAAPTTGDNAYQTYCKALGLGFSPLLDSQEPCNGVLDRWAMLTNTALCWTGYSLLFLPYGTETITGNGVTYLPDLAAKFNFADDDFLFNGTDDPIIARRKRPADCFNHVTFEFTNRANQYNTEPMPWHDQGLIDEFGLKAQDSTQAHEICESEVAATCVTLYGQRIGYVRNEYEWVVAAWNGMVLTTGDIGTVTDPVYGTVSVMLTNVVEEDEGTFRCIADEYATTLGAQGATAVQDVTNTPVNTAVAAHAVNAPIIFEPPSTLAGSVPQIWFAVSAGPSGTFDPNWGGCFVWLSSDNVTFQQEGTIETPARMGTLGGTLASYGGANPDTTHSVAVNLAESAGDLQGVTAADAAAFVTLSVIKDSGGTLEFLSYRDAALTSTYHYTIGGQLYRGLYGTAAGSHVSGAAFARLDENIFKFSLPPQYIGKTIYAKFQSFNSFGSGVQDLASCTVYSYTTLGTGFGGGGGGVPVQVQGLAVTTSGSGNVLNWTANPASDNITAYSVFRANGTGASFGSASQIGTAGANQTTFTDATAIPGQGYTYFVAGKNAVGDGTASAGASATTGQPNPPTNGLTASATLSAGQIVNIFSSSGAKVQPADIADDTKPADGFVLAAVTSGDPATVYGRGAIITGLSSLTAGATYWLAASGGITATVPSSGWRQIVGKALSATTLRFDPDQGTLL